jgi:hypothetical protein
MMSSAIDFLYPPADLDYLYEDMLWDTQQRRTYTHDYYHASELGFDSRRIFLARLIEPQYSLETLGIFAAGTAIHEYIQARLKNVIHTEYAIKYRYKNKFTISGHIDAIMNTNRGITVMDIKTVNPTRWEYTLIKKPGMNYMFQINFYGCAVKITPLEFLFVNKNNMAKHITRHTADPILFDETMDKVLNIQERLIEYKKCEGEPRMDLLPDFDGLSWECNFCPYHKFCQELNILPKKR